MYGDKKYNLAVVDPRTKEPITTGVLVFVYTAGSKTLATIYSNKTRVAKTNPVTRTQFATDQQVEFWAAASSVDIFLADDKGNVAFIPGVTPTDHYLYLDRAGHEKCFVAPFTFNATETDTGLDFPQNVWIYNAMVEVVATDASQTIDVGILSSESGGDTDGILVGVPLDNAVFVKPWANTDTTTEDYISAPYFGALMGKGSAGTSAANDFGQHGGAGYVVGATAKSLVYDGSASIDTGTGYIYVFFRHLR